MAGVAAGGRHEGYAGREDRQGGGQADAGNQAGAGRTDADHARRQDHNSVDAATHDHRARPDGVADRPDRARAGEHDRDHHVGAPDRDLAAGNRCVSPAVGGCHDDAPDDDRLGHAHDHYRADHNDLFVLDGHDVDELVVIDDHDDDHHHDDDHALAARPLDRYQLVARRVIDIDHFSAVDMRVGRIIAVDEFPEARVPAWKLTIDFGPEIGVKRSSARITNYSREELHDTLIVAVVNFPPRRIGPFSSEVLVLGALDADKGVVLLRPDRGAEIGARIA